MNRLQVAAVVTNVIDRMRKKGSWCSETHVQKAAYVAQQLVEIPLGFDFILYKHGPFSFDLRDELTSLRADGLLVLEPQPFPYGPKFNVTETAHELQERFPKTLKTHAEALEFVAQNLANKSVAELERLATALFAKANLPDGDEHERARWINKRKPHVSIKEALQALEEVDSLQEDFQALEIE
jgi:uncharacterized protein YwgA